MFMEAHQRYIGAKRDIDYIVAIVMAGSVVGVVSPLLKEQGGRTSHQLLAEIGNLLIEEGEADFHEGVFREIYNSFKHAGNRNKGLKPSEDMTVEADLKKEAAHMLDAARDDFREIKVGGQVMEGVPEGFIALLESTDEYV